MLYELAKSAHIIAVVIWFGGTIAAALALRHAGSESLSKFVRFDRRATTPAMTCVWIAGCIMAFWYGWFASTWLILKLVFVVGLSAVHGVVSSRLRRRQSNPESSPADFRWTVPTMVLFLCPIVLLVVIKPF